MKKKTDEMTVNKLIKQLDDLEKTHKEKGGFEDDDIYDDKFKPCMHPSHNPPMHLYIPPGKRYRHICPGCGMTIILRTPIITVRT